MVEKKIFEKSKSGFEDDFEQVKLFGQGGFAEVFLCTQRSSSKEVAVKRISKGKLVSDTMYQLLKNEVGIQQMVKGHENIVDILELYEDEQYVYIVQELCAGGDMFKHLIGKGRYSEKDSSDLCRFMLRAVQWCHTNGVIHRDLKPENFLFGGRKLGILKLADFGLASAVQKGELLTQSCGTPFYVAPEVIKKKYDFRADIWSIGVILYVILSGKVPFPGKTDSQIMKAIVKGRYSFLDETWRSISSEAKDVVKSMLKYRPEDRPSATELLENPWIMGNAPGIPIMKSVMTNMKQFYNMNMLQKRVMQMVVENSDFADVEMMQEVFHRVDVNNSGSITVDEMKRALRTLNWDHSDEHVDLLWKTYDVDGDGVINYVEFLTACAKHQELLTAESVEKAFRRINKNGTGYITVSEVKDVLGAYHSDNQVIREIMSEVDRNGDGLIDLEEFGVMMSKHQSINMAAQQLKYHSMNFAELELEVSLR